MPKPFPKEFRRDVIAVARQGDKSQVSRQTISTITDKVVEGMAEWQNRPLDPVYPVVFMVVVIVVDRARMRPCPGSLSKGAIRGPAG